MSKRILPYLALFALAVIAGLLVLKKSHTSLSDDIRDFVPAALTTIDRIEIEQQGHRIFLERQEKWIINSTLPAREEVVQLLLSSISRFEIIAPAPKAGRDELKDRLTKAGRKVTLIARKKVLREFYIGYDTLAVTGTYIFRKDGQTPYRIKIKGYEAVNIENLFSLQPGLWRENSIFGIDAASIAKISVQYPDNPGLSFSISRSGNSFDLSDVSETHVYNPNLEEIQDYLRFFGTIEFRFPDQSLKNHLSRVQQFADINLMLTSNQKEGLTAYPLLHEVTGPGKEDKNWFIALLKPSKDTVLIRYTDIDPLLRKLDDFQKK
jgi:hypothetical protein